MNVCLLTVKIPVEKILLLNNAKVNSLLIS
jgi:hypothetical protein